MTKKEFDKIRQLINRIEGDIKEYERFYYVNNDRYYLGANNSAYQISEDLKAILSEPNTKDDEQITDK